MRKTRSRKEPLDGEIFEILAGFTDFQLFKEMMISYKSVRNNELNKYQQPYYVRRKD